VIADPDGAIAEEDEDNNAASRTVATGATVDLEVTGTDLELVGTPYLGTDVAFRVTVRNRGTLDTPATDLRLTVTDGVTIRQVALDPIQLAGGAAATFEHLWRVDLEGDLELTAELDPGGLVPETDEGNNLAVLQFTAGALDLANLEHETAA
jgi:subtilase family serine protease